MPTVTELLEDYKKNKQSANLIKKFHPVIHIIAQLARGIYHKEDPWFRWFYGLFINGSTKTLEALRDIQSTIALAMRFSTFRECYNQAVVFFLSIAKRFKKHKKGISFKRYIRMILGWRMRNWMNKYLKSPYMSTLLGNVPQIFFEEHIIEQIQPFTMNLSWILYGSNGPLFSTLRPYDRYILYMYFVESRTIREIAKITCQSKDTINKDLKASIEACKKASIKEPQSSESQA